MSDSEKFEGFKQKLIDENEKAYGDEVRARYGAAALEEANRRVAGMSEAAWQRGQKAEAEMFAALAEAMETGDPTGPRARAAAALHAEWLKLFWGEARYSAQAHRAMSETYVSDARFTRYYDERLKPGAAAFLKAAIEAFTQD